MIEGKENFWNDFNHRTGVLQVNESDDGTMQQPLILNAETLDANLLNALQMSLQLMDQLAGINQAQQGNALTLLLMLVFIGKSCKAISCKM